MNLLALLLAVAWGAFTFWVTVSLTPKGQRSISVGSKFRTLVDAIRKMRPAHRLLLAGLFAFVFGVRLALAAGLVSWLIPWWSKRRAAALRAGAIEAAMPEMVELLSVALHGGLGLEEACRAVGLRLEGPLADELNLCLLQIDRGMPFDEALSAFRDRTAGSYRGVVNAILATQRYGLPLASTLERLGGEAKAERRRQSEVRTRRLPVQMLFPLVLLFLPSVLLVVVIPVVGASLLQLTSIA